MIIRKQTVKNTALLTVSSLLMRCIAMSFQVWLAGKIGAAGIGLFQLVMSVSSLAATFAISGIRFTTTRVISQELGAGRQYGAITSVRRCMLYAAFFGTAAMILMYIGAEPIGFLWIGDARTVKSLRILSFSMPITSMSAVICGYFTATGRVYKTAAVQILEQLCRIAIVVMLLKSVPSGQIEQACRAVTLGGTLADVIAFALLMGIYLKDRKQYTLTQNSGGRLFQRILSTALPLAVSAYMRTSLSTFEHLLVPKRLKLSGLTADIALAGYGTIQGMVFPIVLFPSCILSSLSEMLVPDLTLAQVKNDTLYISKATKSLISWTIAFSVTVAAFMFLTADKLSAMIYSSGEAGRYIRMFAPLIPIMYTDMVADGCLKGLGQMMYSMAYNIFDAGIGVVLVLMLLSRLGLPGYIIVIYITETINFSMSLGRLIKIVKNKDLLFDSNILI